MTLEELAEKSGAITAEERAALSELGVWSSPPKAKATAKPALPGLSAYACVGRYGGFGCRRDGGLLRVTLGWIVFGFAACDLEAFWGAVARKLQDEGLVPPEEP